MRKDSISLVSLSLVSFPPFFLHEDICHNRDQQPGDFSFSLQKIKTLPIADTKLVQRGQKIPLATCQLENGELGEVRGPLKQPWFP